MAKHSDHPGAKVLPFRRKNYKPTRDYVTYAILFLALLQVAALIYIITTKV